MNVAYLPGFLLCPSDLSAEECDVLYASCMDIAGQSPHVAHYDAPHESVEKIARDPFVRHVVGLTLRHPRLVHSAIHSNPPGACPLGWHSDDCKPWFHGKPEDAPPAVRIWFFPQDVPVERGPLELIPTGGTEKDAFLATCQAGDFLAVYDMALIHRATANVSGLPRFMIRLEFVER